MSSPLSSSLCGSSPSLEVSSLPLALCCFNTCSSKAKFQTHMDYIYIRYFKNSSHVQMIKTFISYQYWLLLHTSILHIYKYQKPISACLYSKQAKVPPISFYIILCTSIEKSLSLTAYYANNIILLSLNSKILLHFSKLPCTVQRKNSDRKILMNFLSQILMRKILTNALLQ